MYVELASRLVLDGSGAVEYSQPVAMQGEDNSPQVDCVIFHMASGSLDIIVQTSNDLENWEDAFTAVKAATANSEGYFFGDSADKVQAAYVRLKYSLASGNLAILAAGLNTTHQ